jgi:hypothetical protein
MNEDHKYTRDSSDFRLVYEKLHVLMANGIESNGFKAEYEAISFVSCLFSHVMEVDFISNFMNIFVDYHHIQDRDILTTRIRFFIGDMISCVSIEAHALGVSSKYVNSFFSSVNNTNASVFASSLANKRLSSYATLDDMLKSCLHDLYIYMDKSITNAKLVESNKFTVDSETQQGESVG